MSQRDFAQMLGISLYTLRNWEQGRRRPHGPARILLMIAHAYPETIREMMRPVKEHVDYERTAADVICFTPGLSRMPSWGMTYLPSEGTAAGVSYESSISTA